MLRTLPSHEAMRSMNSKREEESPSPMSKPTREGAAEFAARELLRVARKLMPSSVSMKDLHSEEEKSLPQEMRRVASQVLMRPNALFQEIAGGANKRRPSTSKALLEELPQGRAGGRLWRTSSEMLKRNASEAQLPDLGMRHSASGTRLSPMKLDSLLREDDSCVTPVWQPKESDRPCLVPPLCAGTAQIKADSGFFAWANKIVQEVAEDATAANFSVTRVPGPPPAPLPSTTEAIQPPCLPPPWQSVNLAASYPSMALAH
mmetsp:Transcript_4871/g.14150  ORF Transcript_4871/g.14150 Transcript_4871/m.14150 type:complete len:261 (-) Transcript_4871:73-855(-)